MHRSNDATVAFSLTEAGVDYVVETDTFGVGFIFRAERVGAHFEGRIRGDRRTPIEHAVVHT